MLSDIVRDCLFLYLRQLWQQGIISSYVRLSNIVCVVIFYIKCQLIVFIVFSYRRLSDVMCADRHWKLVYRWISAHITLLAEHPPISGSFLFFSITITRIRNNYPLLSKLSLMEFSCALRRREIITSFLWNIPSDYSEITVCTPWNSQICCFRKKNPPIFGAK